MKIIVIGEFRSGSTRLADALSQMYGVEYLDEYVQKKFNHAENISHLLRLQTLDSYCVKIMPYFLTADLYPLVKWRDADIIVASYRANRIDSFLSFEYASQKNKWIRFNKEPWPSESFTASLLNIDWWLPMSQLNAPLVNRVETIIEKPIQRLEYNEICNPTTLHRKIMADSHSDEIVNQQFLLTGMSALTPTELSYSTLCSNYTDVVSKFASMGVNADNHFYMNGILK